MKSTQGTKLVTAVQHCMELEDFKLKLNDNLDDWDDVHHRTALIFDFRANTKLRSIDIRFILDDTLLHICGGDPKTNGEGWYTLKDATLVKGACPRSRCVFCLMITLPSHPVLLFD
jgi:hypothetical protein